MDPEQKKPVPSEGSDSQPRPEQKKPSAELSPEEQMALYEDSLKESDWGHQPC